MIDPTPPAQPRMSETCTPLKLFLLFTGLSVLVSFLVYRSMDFDAAELPKEYFHHVHPVSVPYHHNHILDVMERIGDGLLPDAEDLAYDADANLLYTSCTDGWIKRINLGEGGGGGGGARLQMENWTFVGGRPAGVALSPDCRRLYVANTAKGLMAVERDGTTTVLTDEADGLKLGLTDGVDVASDGMVYFTDASYKYNTEAMMLEVLEGRPHGRLLGFDPSTNQTQVLVRDLYFANGVTVSPAQDFLVFCETFMRRCRSYHIRGDSRGTVDNFIDNLPGYPDNIRYDGKDGYWIGILWAKTTLLELAFKYPFLRNVMAFTEKNIGNPNGFRDGGVLEVSLDGKPVSLHTDPRLHLVTGGIKIGKHLYLGFLKSMYIGRVELATR